MSEWWALDPRFFSQAKRPYMDAVDPQFALTVHGARIKYLEAQVEKEHQVAEELKEGLNKQYAQFAQEMDAKDEEVKRLNIQNGELKALLWKARDAVTDHDFPKGHRYDVLCNQIERVLGPGDRCRFCGVPVSRQAEHVCA